MPSRQAGRQAGRQREWVSLGLAVGFYKLKAPAYDTMPPTMLHIVILPIKSTNWEPYMETRESVGIILIQTNTQGNSI